MKTIVLLSNGITDHNFYLFPSKEEAEFWVTDRGIRKQYQIVIITELINPVQL